MSQPVPGIFGWKVETQRIAVPGSRLEVDLAEVVADRQVGRVRVGEAAVRDELDDLVVAGDAAGAEEADGANALRLVGSGPLELEGSIGDQVGHVAPSRSSA